MHKRMPGYACPWVITACAVQLATGLAGAAPTTPDSHDNVATVQAVRVQEPPVLDGRLDDEAWRGAKPAVDFLQRDPDEGQPGTERTELRIVYDEAAIYVGGRLFDSEPTRIARRLSRRDAPADADRFTIYLDPHHDHLTGAMFQVSAAGVLTDSIIHNDTWTDSSWDAVWEAAVTMDDQGWSVEMRIPFSQLRFSSSTPAAWGVNALRFIHRKNESAWLVLVPKKENGLASRMAHLTGLTDLRSTSRTELLPYVTGRAEFIAPQSSLDPFNDGSRLFGGVGMDVKFGLASNLTIDATINPDFGQVEVDPAVVNLTAFETFFEERRPFFIEGAQVFHNFGRGGSNSFWGFNAPEPLIFYSRRIGRAPQGEASAAFVDRPAASTILGAAKLTGKTSSGWNIGLLDAVTGREYTRTADGTLRGRTETEPVTNYFVGRVQREAQRAGVGALATSVERRFEDDRLRATMPARAYVIGGDGYVFLDGNREWVVTGMLAGSSVRGSQEAILGTQMASQRYLQRPDASRLNPLATRLSGWTGRLSLNRNSGLWQLNAAVWGTSPGFDSGDLGFTWRAGIAGAHSVLLWRKPTPDRFTRSRGAWIAKSWTWDFDRRLQADGWNAVGFMEFKNYWELGAHVGFRRTTRDNWLTRGGPTALDPGGGTVALFGRSDSRRTVAFNTDVNHSWNRFGGWGSFGRVSLSVKPASALTISVGPEIRRFHNVAQYVDTVTDEAASHTLGARYVFADLNQTQVSMVTRVNWVLNPRISLQLYAQPLLSTGDYGRFKELARPATFDFTAYGDQAGTIAYDPAARRYLVDPDHRGPSPSFELDDPDFNFKSLRLNTVFRWEWRRGSTLYVVWTQLREDARYPGDFSFGRDARTLFSAPANDVLLVKFAYWIGR